MDAFYHYNCECICKYLTWVHDKVSGCFQYNRLVTGIVYNEGSGYRYISNIGGEINPLLVAVIWTQVQKLLDIFHPLRESTSM